MVGEPFDVIIVGLGLAGTTLAWHLLQAGQKVLLIDANEAVTCSKIAAGLITPITGQRLVLSWRVDKFLGECESFFADVERRTGQRFFYSRAAIRLFLSAQERQIWGKRKSDPAVHAHLADPQPAPLVDPALVDANFGGFVMQSAQLDVATYLAASRATLPWVPMVVDWHTDVTVGPDLVSVGRFKARRLISCEGFAATRNPYFWFVPFIAAKGEILTIRFERAVPAVCFHRGVWVAPTKDPQIFRVGSTYDWEHLNQAPTIAAREDIERKLQAFFHVPYAVIDHKAAVRPIIQQSKAVVGLHPMHERLGYFNGLGSKGSLHAPWYARLFTEFLVKGTPLPEEIDLRKNF